MKDYIEQEKVFNDLLDQCKITGYGGLTANDVKYVFSLQTADDVRPVVRGKWEEVEIKYWDDMDEETQKALVIASMFCPNCKRYHNEVYIYGNPTENVNFCSYCGADMRGEKN